MVSLSLAVMLWRQHDRQHRVGSDGPAGNPYRREDLQGPLELNYAPDDALRESVNVPQIPRCAVFRHGLAHGVPVLSIDGLPQRTLVESHTWCEVRRHNEQGR